MRHQENLALPTGRNAVAGNGDLHSRLALSHLAPKVPFHSIIGQQRPGPPEGGSDGVVTYASSHLDGAESELVVRSGHRLLNNPDATRQVIRILRLLSLWRLNFTVRSKDWNV